MSNNLVDPVKLTQRLVQCKSVTPLEGGALQLLSDILVQANFSCTRVDRNGIPNLFARWGNEGPVFGFNGHTDTVPVGDLDAWSVDPFGGEIKQEKLWGRGAADMKSGVAAFVAAAVSFVRESPPKGSLIITITGDEEARAVDGTIAIFDWMEAQNQKMDVCIVGEPTCPEIMGEAIKIGRRGSLSVKITMLGVQGHSAYPERYINPVEAMVHLGYQLTSTKLDEGTDNFQPSNLALSSIETGNETSNIVPGRCTALLNIRFSDQHSSKSLLKWIRDEVNSVASDHKCEGKMEVLSSAESFITPKGDFTDLVANAVYKTIGIQPELSTSGGTSDARFIIHHCPVVEVGLVGKTIHQVDEHVEIQQIRDLKSIYVQCFKDYFQ